MSDGLVVTTGANGLLGLAIANALAAAPDPNLTALFTLRSLSKGTTLESTLSPSSQKYQLMPVDMSSLASVREFATSLSALIDSGSLPRIRALICAAAVMQVGGKRTTGDRMEATFQVNYLANFQLVMLLLPVMRRDCRIVFLTSNLIYEEGRPGASKVARFDEYVSKLPDPVVEDTGSGKTFAEGTARYAISKVLLSMFATELQRRCNASSEFRGNSVVLLDPGTFISGTIREYPPLLRTVATCVVPLLAYLPLSFKKLVRTNFTSATQAASNVLTLVLDRDVSFSDAGGKVFAWGLKEVPLTLDARNEKYCSDLWKKSMAWARLGEGEEKVPLE